MRKLLNILLPAILLGTALISCNFNSEIEQPEDTFYFITRLGSDTLAVEKISQYSDSITATVLLRSPQLKIVSYGFSARPSHQSFRAISSNPINNEVVDTEIVRWANDSLNVSLRNGEIQKNIAANDNILPFIEMIHWPFEIMVNRAFQKELGAKLNQQVWAGNRTFNFEIKKLNSDSIAIIHPSRGAMGVSVSGNGELNTLDAAMTTRKLVVTRHNDLDFDKIESNFIISEKAGKGIGALSGRGKTIKTIQGISYEIDYGTPSKRGREIWGALVPYRERWRTGANRATHFKIDKSIQINELKIPAGEYTLFTIPFDDTCELIINKQTGQNGRTYDPAMDLGRIEMFPKELPAPVEVFTIDIIERENKAYLSLQWDMKSYEVELKK